MTTWAPDGIAAAAMIHVGTPQSAVVMLSIHDDVSTRARAQVAGAAAFVNKNGAIEGLVATIRQAAQHRKDAGGIDHTHTAITFRTAFLGI